MHLRSRRLWDTVRSYGWLEPGGYNCMCTLRKVKQTFCMQNIIVRICTCTKTVNNPDKRHNKIFLLSYLVQ
jgi:hypothetical protein